MKLLCRAPQNMHPHPPPPLLKNAFWPERGGERGGEREGQREEGGWGVWNLFVDRIFILTNFPTILVKEGQKAQTKGNSLKRRRSKERQASKEEKLREVFGEWQMVGGEKKPNKHITRKHFSESPNGTKWRLYCGIKQKTAGLS